MNIVCCNGIVRSRANNEHTLKSEGTEEIIFVKAKFVSEAKGRLWRRRYEHQWNRPWKLSAGYVPRARGQSSSRCPEICVTFCGRSCAMRETSNTRPRPSSSATARDTRVLFLEHSSSLTFLFLFSLLLVLLSWSFFSYFDSYIDHICIYRDVVVVEDDCFVQIAKYEAEECRSR